ncbi:formimidoylglutamase [Legionella beliardensis]|uniref:Formimidoylglutamase n=1 Tax=Legionella beliardensis TaxID=91822 RepID=A0A378IB69_9GAMM|nr:formimidoylglutamase [Legionella beliardensis]STX29554.1 formimidoylglutamase [Legionella beliardensis]
MLPEINNYEPPITSIWQGRKDSLPHERFFQAIKAYDIRIHSLQDIKSQTVFLGFNSDEGIRRNEGRLGAKEGPMALREQLAKLPWHAKRQLYDLGNIACKQQDLEEAQHQFADIIRQCHEHHCKTIALGGGHEIAWGHFLGLTNHYPKLGVINFDAHFDLRPTNQANQSTSGTPFYQIQRYCASKNRPFNYCCLGIQPHANTESLFKLAKDYNVSFLTAQQMNELGLKQQIKFIKEFISKQEAIYLSICLDTFAEAFAPGVSAPQALGLLPGQAVPLLQYIIQTGKVVSIDIAELSPPLDQGQKTARLAAMLIAELLESY